VNKKWAEHRRVMENLVRLSKVEEEFPDFPIGSRTLRTWVKDGRHRALFARLGAGTFLRLDKLQEMIASGDGQ